MFNWFWKWLGYHVCEEFTRWETKQANYSRPRVRYDDGCFQEYSEERITYTRRWQERTCTICGKVEQRELN